MLPFAQTTFLNYHTELDKIAKNHVFWPTCFVSRRKFTTWMARGFSKCLRILLWRGLIKRLILLNSMPSERALSDAFNGACNFSYPSMQPEIWAFESVYTDLVHRRYVNSA